MTVSLVHQLADVLTASVCPATRIWLLVPASTQPVYRAFRDGDVRHSLADISKAATLLGYAPTHRIGEGLDLAMPWYLQQEK